MRFAPSQTLPPNTTSNLDTINHTYRTNVIQREDGQREHEQQSGKNRADLYQQPKQNRRQSNRDRRHMRPRRQQQQPVLMELRSGKDRRRRHLRATDPIRHIDIKA